MSTAEDCQEETDSSEEFTVYRIQGTEAEDETEAEAEARDETKITWSDGVVGKSCESQYHFTSERDLTADQCKKQCASNSKCVAISHWAKDNWCTFSTAGQCSNEKSDSKSTMYRVQESGETDKTPAQETWSDGEAATTCEGAEITSMNVWDVDDCKAECLIDLTCKAAVFATNGSGLCQTFTAEQCSTGKNESGQTLYRVQV